MSKPGDESAVAVLRVSADGATWVDVSAPVQSVDVEDHDRLTDKVVIVFDDNTGLLADASVEGLRVRVGMGWQAEQATVFVHDAYPGGAGFAERGYALGATWLRATREAIATCPCRTGCPACVQSPKCGNGNNPLEKAAAVRLLDAVLAYAP